MNCPDCHGESNVGECPRCDNRCPDCGGRLAYLTHHPEEDPDASAPHVLWGEHLPEYGCVDPIEEAYRLGFRAGWKRCEDRVTS